MYKEFILVGIIIGGLVGGILVADISDSGLSTYEEIQYGTDPLSPDSNNNGLTDGEEVEMGLDPLKLDTNGDGLSDARAVELGLDPTKEDSNGDGLTDVEKLERGLDPLKLDTNGDGLSDAKAVEMGLDPLKEDSSGDGHSDYYAVQNEELDPHRLNVVVEFNYSSDVTMPDLQPVVESFDSAPVVSDTGERGINLVLIDDGAVDKGYDSRLSYEEFRGIYGSEFDNSGNGVYYAYFTNEFSSDQTLGATSSDIDGFVVDVNDRWEDDAVVTFKHELGHQMGLWTYTFDGIDSERYDYGEYSSVMNYNQPYNRPLETKLTYSESGVFNEYDYIEQNLYRHQAENDGSGNIVG